MFCVNCGSEIGEGRKFCDYCGTKSIEEDIPLKSKKIKPEE